MNYIPTSLKVYSWFPVWGLVPPVIFRLIPALTEVSLTLVTPAPKQMGKHVGLGKAAVDRHFLGARSSSLS